MPAIYLVRHGQASFGAADYDVLSEVGHAQAALTAAALLEEIRGPRRVVAGSLVRQQGTAAAIADALGTSVDTDPRWNEYEAARVLEHHVAADDPARGAVPQAVTSTAFQGILDAALESWIAAGEGSPAPETWPAFSGAVRGGLEDLGAGLASGETAVVVTSGGPIATVCSELLGTPAGGFLHLNRMTVNASISRVIVGARGATLVSFNEQAHLARAGREFVTYR